MEIENIDIKIWEIAHKHFKDGEIMAVDGDLYLVTQHNKNNEWLTTTMRREYNGRRIKNNMVLCEEVDIIEEIERDYDGEYLYSNYKIKGE